MKPTALITGSSRGIGKAIALGLAKEGYQIILHGLHDSEALQTTAAELRKLDALAMTTWFDTSQKEAVAEAFKNIFTKTKQIAVLVNNAAIVKDNILLKLSESEWDSVLQTNLSGPFYVTKHVLPLMKKEQFGRIINIASIAARGAYGKTNYATAKAGLIGFSKSLAFETAKDNITVNVLCPGFFATEMNNSMPVKYQEELLSQVPMGRKGQPAEIASMVAQLVKPESEYITGAVIDINGGLGLAESL